MHQHYFIPYRVCDGVRQPSMVDDCDGWALLACASAMPEWGVFECSHASDMPVPPQWIPAPSTLDALLQSAHGYPPALALMQDRIASMHNMEPWTLEMFVEQMCSGLMWALGSQFQHRFLLAEAAVDALPLVAGGWYWITGFYPEADYVQWVDAVMFDYAPRAFFALDRTMVLHLIPTAETPWLPDHCPTV